MEDLLCLLERGETGVELVRRADRVFVVAPVVVGESAVEWVLPVDTVLADAPVAVGEIVREGVLLVGKASVAVPSGGETA